MRDGDGELHRAALLNDVLLQTPVQLVADPLYSMRKMEKIIIIFPKQTDPAPT